MLMKTVQLLQLIFAIVQCAGGQGTDPNELPCGDDNLSCVNPDPTILECFSTSDLCDGIEFCSNERDEGRNENALDCEFTLEPVQFSINLIV